MPHAFIPCPPNRDKPTFMKTTSLVCALLLAIPFASTILAATLPAGQAAMEIRLRPNGDGTTTIRFRGAAGGTYRIESSDNLEAWTMLAEDVTAGTDWTEWNDSRSSATAQRFYRVTSASGTMRTAMRAVDPNTDSERLLAALASKDDATVISILRANGISDATLAVIATNLTQTPLRAALAEPFFHGAISVATNGSSDEVRERFREAVVLNYGNAFWLGKDMSDGWESRYDLERGLFPSAPVGVLDFTLGDTNLVTFFKWYDRYAEGLHSVVINWTHLSNHVLSDGYTNVNTTLSGLYKLIKARKPDAFVWAGVVKKDDLSDTPWLQSFTFEPDGLLIWNLRQFHSPFAETRARYLPMIGADTPMVVASFYGYKEAVRDAGEKLHAARAMSAGPERVSAQAKAEQRQADIGKITRELIGKQEVKLQELGYRGLTLHGLLIESLSQADKVK
jgi:hypothetical protein